MNLYEYQAKTLFADAGIAVPRGCRAAAIEDLGRAVDEVGPPCILKAQMLRGGRGKAGLIRPAEDRAAALAHGRSLFAAAPDVHGILVEERIDIAAEWYLSCSVNAVAGSITVMLSDAGGIDIEETAVAHAERIRRTTAHPCHGIMPFHLRHLLKGFAVSREEARHLGRVVRSLHALMRECDATLVEVNPLALTSDGEFVALDGKVVLDDNALFRQNFEPTAATYADDIEFEAALEGIPYVRLEGDIGLMCAGAGLTNTVSDLIHDFGGKPANFLEFGGPNYRRAATAMRLTMKANPKVILIVTFGTIARADVMAEGITAAIEELRPPMPIITAIRGTNEEQAAHILREAGLEPLSDTEEAVRRAVSLAKEARA